MTFSRIGAPAPAPRRRSGGAGTVERGTHPVHDRPPRGCRGSADAMDPAEAGDRPPHRARGGASCPNLPQRPGSGRSAREETLVFRAFLRGRSRLGAPLWQIWTRPRPESPQKPHQHHSNTLQNNLPRSRGLSPVLMGQPPPSSGPSRRRRRPGGRARHDGAEGRAGQGRRGRRGDRRTRRPARAKAPRSASTSLNPRDRRPPVTTTPLRPLLRPFFSYSRG